MCVEKSISESRSQLGFPSAVEESFGFLRSIGFRPVETQPTLVRFERHGLVASVYHGRSSFEIGFEIGYDDESYSLGALIRAEDPAKGTAYRNPVATTPAEVTNAVESVASLVRQYGQRAIEGDPAYFATLQHQRHKWAESYSLDVLAEQVRPKAEAAFREGRYSDAAELYAQIAPRLTVAEQKKLAVARKRR